MVPQPHSVKEEIRRQRVLLWRERWARLPLSVMAILMTTIYLPVWLAVVCAALNLGAEIASMHYMRALDPQRHPRRYAIVIAGTVAMEFFYVLPATLIWQGEAHYAKAFAIGMLSSTLIQVIGVRSIHFPFGVSALAAVSVTAYLGNMYFWIAHGNFTGLAASSLALTGALIYTFITMKSNNRLHTTAADARVAAQDSSKAKSRFLAQMSHELRTPLNAILGMGHAEHRRAKDTLGKNRLAVLIASAEGLSTILDDILDMSAIEAGRLPIRPEIVLPSAEVLATINLFQPAITEAGLQLTHRIDPQLATHWQLDPQRLRQCMSNLLSNALKNTSHGSIRVTADMVADANGAAQMRISISDTGPGIASHLHATLFEPFSKARRPQIGGDSHGLGLSICRVMARQMGGDVTIAPNTKDRSGARFILTLQLAPPPPQAAATACVTAETAPKTKTTTTGLRVLVVDDIATNRLVASTYLRMLGAAMIEAESGEKALELLSTTRPDLILLDMNMPEMDGLQTLARIRALAGPVANVPVIAMTADALADHRALYMAAGVDGYLAKPINPARIEAEIKAVLDKTEEPRPD